MQGLSGLEALEKSLKHAIKKYGPENHEHETVVAKRTRQSALCPV